MNCPSRNQSAVLIHHLDRLDPLRSSAVIRELLQVFLCVDVTLHTKITDWLRPAFGWSTAKTMVQSAMSEVACPLMIVRSGDGRPCLICYASSDDSILSRGVDSAAIMVPYTTPDDTERGFLPAVIHEGDFVKLKCYSSITWQVFSILSSEGKVVLAVHCRGNDNDGKFTKNFPQIVPPSIKSRSRTIFTPDKRSFWPAELVGAIVWKVVSAPLSDREPTEIYLENDYSESDYGADDVDNKISVCSVFQMPTTPWEYVLKKMLNLVKEHESTNSGSTAAASNRSNANQLVSLRKFSHHIKCQSAGVTTSNKLIRSQSLTAPEPLLLNLVSDGYHAQAHSWLKREKDVQDARHLLWGSDPFSCCLASCREKWILTCRALRTVCKGDRDLLDDFCRWTSSAGEEGRLRARDCRVVWSSLRPLTTSDLPCVVQARVYVRAFMHSRSCEGQEEDFEPASNISFRSIEASCKTDPALSAFIEAASTVLKGRSLFFISSVHDSAAPSIAQCPAGALMVPAAVYESGPPCTELNDDEGEGGYKDTDSCPNERSKESNAKVLVRALHVPASVSPGDVLLLPSFNSSSSGAESWSVPCANYRETPSAPSSSQGRRSTWHRVVAVDLFYARLRVSPCPPPPECWRRHVTLPSVWCPVSCLWAVSVCQLLPPKSPDSALNVLYQIYVTPIPSLSASFAALASLPRRDVDTYRREQSVQTDPVKKKQKDMPDRREALKTGHSRLK
jgi:hypothetical protein